MTKLVLKLDDGLASQLNSLAEKPYKGDENAVVSDALLLLFLQPIRKDRRQLARLIYDIRAQMQAAGGVTDKEIERLRNEYRQRKSTGQ